MMQQVYAIAAVLLAFATLLRGPSRWLVIGVPEFETNGTVLVSSV
jgi:hypothetical protein